MARAGKNDVDLLKVAASEDVQEAEGRLGARPERGERLFPASFEASGSVNASVTADSIRISRD